MNKVLINFAHPARDSENEEPEADTITHSGQKVIFAGFGRMGTDLGRFLLSAGIKPVIIDHDPANASDLSAAYDLMDAGVSTIRRETFSSALALGQDALKLLGFDPYEAYRMMPHCTKCTGKTKDYTFQCTRTIMQTWKNSWPWI